MAQGNKTWRYLAIGCGVLTLLGACCLAGGYFAWSSCTKAGPHVHAWLHDLQDGNYAAALQRMDGPCQSTWTAAAFQEQVAAHPALTSHVDATMRNYNFTNDRWTVSGSLRTPAGPVPIQVNLRQEGKHFYIWQVLVDGQRLACPE